DAWLGAARADPAATTSEERMRRARARTAAGQASPRSLRVFELGGRHVHAVSSTGARTLSGSHQSRWPSYQSTVSASPSGQECSGLQPSSEAIFDASSR